MIDGLVIDMGVIGFAKLVIEVEIGLRVIISHHPYLHLHNHYLLTHLLFIHLLDLWVAHCPPGKEHLDQCQHLPRYHPSFQLLLSSTHP